mgnify:CR=1 FL=1
MDVIRFQNSYQTLIRLYSRDQFSYFYCSINLWDRIAITGEFSPKSHDTIIAVEKYYNKREIRLWTKSPQPELQMLHSRELGYARVQLVFHE